jgi:hypothetical protein
MLDLLKKKKLRQIYTKVEHCGKFNENNPSEKIKEGFTPRTLAAPEKDFRVVALYPYVAQTNGELTFKKGDEILVTKKHPM